MVGAALVGMFVAALAFVNLDPVRVDWIFSSTVMPLIVVIVTAFGCGVLVGWLVIGRHGGAS